ncbi:MAG: histidine ammonia-lyase [Actinomycetota bacterium]|jgi:histidine ammonia-lyase|nr:histidine ammonia-lyase [Actinomycetota bacterium]
MAVMVVVGREPLSVADVVAVARGGERVEAAADLDLGMAAARAVVERAVDEGRTVYGVTTGFGALASTRFPVEQAAQVQYALVQSHAAGMGADVDREVVRAMQVLKARTLAAGTSGARPLLVRAIIDLLNAGITPAVPEMGSLGASGDLAPLAHAAIVLLGNGWVLDLEGRRADAGPALAGAGLEPIRLEAKEGLALLNGTEGMLAHLCLALADLDVVLRTADVTCALSVEALRGTDAPFAGRIQALRPHAGQAASAANLRRLLAGSPIVESHRDIDHAVQDAYSLRCAPQVHGAARDVVEWCRRVVLVELASVTDNPVVFPETDDVVSTGNFHGQPLAYAADFATIALADLASIVERRVDRLMDPARSDGLPPFLAPEAGVNSGFMLAHYTAAALVSRLRGLATPASCDSVSTSAGQEDHVSMGWNACLSLRSAVTDAMRVVAIELVCAAEAVELRGLAPAPATGAVLACLRRRVPRMDVDRFLAPDLAAAEELVRSGEILRSVPVELD